MAATDTIADMLTRIRNALSVKFSTVEVPSSRLKEQLLKTLKDEGYIKGFDVHKRGARQFAKIELKYGKNGEQVVHEINRISTPGCRMYIQKQEIPRLKSGYGITILSTNKGIMTGEQARKSGIGGEILCEVW